MSRILIVEDESHLAQGLLFNLEAEGHEASVVETGESALESLGEHNFDLIVLDVMLPGVSGFDVAKELRHRGNYVPVLMLTARSRAEDVLEGLAAGADDYLPKPFELSILLARIRSLLRRSQWSRQKESAPTEESVETAPVETVMVDDRTIDLTNLELRYNGETVRLTLMEADLLRYFFRNSGRVISRKQILDEVWGLREDTDTRAIDNFIVRLRRYLEIDPAHPKRLLTVRGVGYRFEPEK
jgi:two-component system alkaline phosphatase synthesis response regulator PhoP